MPDIDDLIRNLRQFRATVVRDIPRQLGQEMLEQTHESFKEERFAGSPGGKWPDRSYGFRRGKQHQIPQIGLQRLSEEEFQVDFPSYRTQ